MALPFEGLVLHFVHGRRSVGAHHSTGPLAVKKNCCKFEAGPVRFGHLQLLFVQSLLHLLAILERQQKRRLHAARVLDNELVVCHAAAGRDGHAAHNEMVALRRKEKES